MTTKKTHRFQFAGEMTKFDLQIGKMLGRLDPWYLKSVGLTFNNLLRVIPKVRMFFEIVMKLFKCFDRCENYSEKKNCKHTIWREFSLELTRRVPVIISQQCILAIHKALECALGRHFTFNTKARKIIENSTKFALTMFSPNMATSYITKKAELLSVIIILFYWQISLCITSYIPDCWCAKWNRTFP